jgi:hypothetical protein
MLKYLNIFSTMIDFAKGTIAYADKAKENKSKRHALKEYAVCSIIDVSVKIMEHIIETCKCDPEKAIIIAPMLTRSVLDNYISLKIINIMSYVVKTKFECKFYPLFDMYKNTNLDKDGLNTELLLKLFFYNLVAEDVVKKTQTEEMLLKDVDYKHEYNYLARDPGLRTYFKKCFRVEGESKIHQEILDVVSKVKYGWDGSNVSKRIDFIKSGYGYLKFQQEPWIKNLYDIYSTLFHGAGVINTKLFAPDIAGNSAALDERFIRETFFYLQLLNNFIYEMFLLYNDFCKKNMKSDLQKIRVDYISQCNSIMKSAGKSLA